MDKVNKIFGITKYRPDLMAEGGMRSASHGEYVRFDDYAELEQERDQLKEELKQIENLPPAFKNAKPAETYDGLLKQFNSMKGWANSQQKQVKFYREKDYKHSKELMLSNADNINALRDENEQLTNLLLAAENSVPDIQAKAIEDLQTYFDKEYYGEELSQFIEQYAEKLRQQSTISEQGESDELRRHE